MKGKRKALGMTSFAVADEDRGRLTLNGKLSGESCRVLINENEGRLSSDHRSLLLFG